MSKKVSIDEALKLGLRTPPRQMTGYKRKLNPESPPDTTSRPEDIMDVDLPTPRAARKMAFEASAVDRGEASAGRKSRRRKLSKKARKTRRRKSRK